MNKPRIIFAGTPEFAVASLEALVDAGRAPCGVLTQPDRPAGRGKRLAASPVKQYAQDNALTVMQPATLRGSDVLAGLSALEPDIMIVAAYGLILPQAVLEIPRVGCLNVHASLLPRWRGASPIQAAILAGDTQSGVCLMKMDAGLDTGPVYASETLNIDGRETAGSLHDRLAGAGGALLVRTLDDVLSGALVGAPQQDDLATFAAKIKSADAELRWLQTADKLARQVRAYNPVPGAWFILGGERVKCWAASVAVGVDAQPGTVLSSSAAGIDVACGEGVLRLESVQRPGKRSVTAAEFSSQVDIAGQVL